MLAYNRPNNVIAYVFLGVAALGTLPSAVPFVVAGGALLGLPSWEVALGSLGVLAFIAVGFALMLRYALYVTGHETRPTLLWSLTLGYNALLGAFFYFVEFGIWLELAPYLTASSLALTLLAAVALVREVTHARSPRQTSAS